jgi:hypothetical protein
LDRFRIGSCPRPADSFSRTRGPSGFPGYFAFRTIFFTGFAVEGAMTKKDKIAFIKSSKRKTHVYNNLDRYTDQQLNDVIREIVQGLIRESEIIANAYINGYR